MIKVAAMVLLVVAAGANAQPRFDDVRTAYRPSDVTLLDRRGEAIQTLRIDLQARRLPWVGLDALSPSLRWAIVLSEDRRFWEHSGVDWSALARSAFANAWNRRTQGASTVTMQLAALLDDGLARPAGGRTMGQKLAQIGDARAIETRWSKAQILEAYLNLVPLRGELVGVNAGAQMLFGRHPAGLDVLQSAVMAALVRAPNAAPEPVTRRACELLEAQKWPCDGLAAVVAAAFARKAGAPLGEALAPHAARQALAALDARTMPPRVTTTLDASVQRLALRTLRQQLAELQGRHVNDGAVLVLDNASGDVLAWVGSSGDAASPTHQVDAVLARRQPGSTLKPFVYELAFEQRLITPQSLLDDAPTQLAGGNGLYAPQNYDRDFKGWVSARVALASSLNVPAVRVGQMVGIDALFERLDAWGLRLAQNAGYHGPALALGSAEVTLADLTNAYRALANHGRWSAWRLLPAAAAPAVPVADPAASHLVAEILADNTARALTFGLDSPLVTRGFAAVKTGTSKDLRDNWCVGFTDRYTVGVWVGNAAGEPMHGVSGTTGAAPIWRALVSALHEGRPSRAPPPPAGLVAATVDGGSRSAWFIAGTEPERSLAAPATPVRFEAGIAHPLDGSRFALDPDIPPASQRIVFRGESGTWLLDGRVIGRGESVSWRPWPGPHRLELRTADGRSLGLSHFEVRGAVLKTHAAPIAR